MVDTEGLLGVGRIDCDHNAVQELTCVAYQIVTGPHRSRSAATISRSTQREDATDDGSGARPRTSGPIDGMSSPTPPLFEKRDEIVFGDADRA